MSRETKTLAFQVKAVGTKTNALGQELGEIEAYGAMFGNIDEGNDRINPGSFKRTIQNSKARAKARQKDYLLKMLWQHDDHEVIGGWFDLSEDAQGLLAKGDVLLSTQRGREYYDLAKAGMIDEFSIIYDVPQGGAKYDKAGVRDLTELRLFSIDPVTFAMNDATYTVGVKATAPKGKNPMPPKTAKDFNDLYQAAQAADCLEDWADLINTLSQTMMQVFAMADATAPDMTTALAQFGAAVKVWEANAATVDLAGYISDQGYCSLYGSDTPYVPYSLRAGGSMARDTATLASKEGRSISAANQQVIDDHVSNIKALATAHAKAVRTAADDFASIMQGAEPTYAAPNAGTPDEQEGKQSPRGASPMQARSPQARSSKDTAHRDEQEELTNALSNIRALRKTS